MLHADWLHELLLGCILAKSARNISKVLAAEKHLSLALTSERCFVSIFFFDQLVGLMASESIDHSAIRLIGY